MDWIATAPMIPVVLMLAFAMYGYVALMDLRIERRRSSPGRTEPSEATFVHSERVILALARGLEQAVARDQQRSLNRATLPTSTSTASTQACPGDSSRAQSVNRRSASLSALAATSNTSPGNTRVCRSVMRVSWSRTSAVTRDAAGVGISESRRAAHWRLDDSNVRLRASSSSRHLPAPAETDDGGSSGTCTAMPVSCSRR